MLPIPPVVVQESRASDKRSSVLIRIFSTWGHKKKVGMTKMEIFDEKGQRLVLKQEDIALITKLESSSGRSRLYRLVDGASPQMTKEREMWQIVYSFPTQGADKEVQPLELSLSLPSGSRPSHIHVWNFNQANTQTQQNAACTHAHNAHTHTCMHAHTQTHALTLSCSRPRTA